MHEHRRTVVGGGSECVFDTLVVQAKAVHRREQADSAKFKRAKRAGQARCDLAGRRVEHEEADKPRWVAPDSDGH